MEIGHVPFKLKDEIQKQYREVVDKLFEKMDVNKFEMTKAGFQNKVEMLKSGPDSGRRLSQERYNLANRVAKIKDEVTVWENNIGFLPIQNNLNCLVGNLNKRLNGQKRRFRRLKPKC